MTQIIVHGLIIALVVFFIHATTWDGMINAWIKKIIKPEGMLYKPIYGCPICQSPWYGALMMLIFYPSASIGEWIVTLMVAGGFSVISVCLLAFREAAITYSKLNEKKIEAIDKAKEKEKEK